MSAAELLAPPRAGAPAQPNPPTCHGAGRAYLWSPFALLACLSGSAAPLHNLLAIGAAAAAAAGRPLLAGAALAAAAHVHIQSLLYAVGAPAQRRLVPWGFRVAARLLPP